MSDEGTLRIPPPTRKGTPYCKGQTVIRHSRDHENPELRGQPILDEDNARQYRDCIAWAANGTEYCAAHGGLAPQAIAAARRTIALATPKAAAVLELIANDATAPFETRLKAANSLLDRGGVRAGVDLSLETPAWQKMLAEEFGGEEPSTEDDEPSAAETIEATTIAIVTGKPAKAARPAKKAAPAPRPPVGETKPAKLRF